MNEKNKKKMDRKKERKKGVENFRAIEKKPKKLRIRESVGALP